MRTYNGSSPRSDLDVLDYSNDRLKTIEKERSRMAQTFSSLDKADKFLPQVVRSGASQSPSAGRRQNTMIGSPYQKGVSQRIVNDYQDDLYEKEFDEVQTRLLHQTPENGSKMDYAQWQKKS